jgi:hypothetical protein
MEVERRATYITPVEKRISNDGSMTEGTEG